MNYKDFGHQEFEKIPKGNKITALKLELDNKVATTVLVFSEKVGVYTCLLPADAALFKLPEISGLSIRYERFAETGDAQKDYILIECNAQAYLKYFTDILKEIITEFDRSNAGMSICVGRVISRWRHFLSAPISQILSEEDILGLLGEIVFLRKLVVVFGPESVLMWTADRGEEDFIYENLIIEVKSSLKEFHQHVINGIDQLHVASQFKKYLLSFLFVRMEIGDIMNLPLIIDEITEKLREFPKEQDTFYQKLKLRGYDIRDSQNYLPFSYHFLKGGYFEINEDFPKLTTQSLINPLSPRISKIRYLVDLEGLPNFDFSTFDLKSLFK